MNLFILIFLVGCALFLGIKLGANDTPQPVTYNICVDTITRRNTPDDILHCIDFVGKQYRFDITTDFRLVHLRNEYEALRQRIYELAVYLQTDHGQQDREYKDLRQQLAMMYAYLEILELRCINDKFLLPNDIHEES